MRSETLVLLSVLALAGCSRTTMRGSVADDRNRMEATSELDFWDGLSVEPAVTNHDALHAIVASYRLAEEGTALDYSALREIAARRDWVDASSELFANETASPAWIARAVCIESGIEGGLTMRLIGPVPRYALRELQRMGFMPVLSQNQTITGLQLIALLEKARVYQARDERAPTEGL